MWKWINKVFIFIKLFFFFPNLFFYFDSVVNILPNKLVETFRVNSKDPIEKQKLSHDSRFLFFTSQDNLIRFLDVSKFTSEEQDDDDDEEEEKKDVPAKTPNPPTNNQKNNQGNQAKSIKSNKIEKPKPNNNQNQKSKPKKKRKKGFFDDL